MCVDSRSAHGRGGKLYGTTTWNHHMEHPENDLENDMETHTWIHTNDDENETQGERPSRQPPWMDPHPWRWVRTTRRKAVPPKLCMQKRSRLALPQAVTKLKVRMARSPRTKIFKSCSILHHANDEWRCMRDAYTSIHIGTDRMIYISICILYLSLYPYICIYTHRHIYICTEIQTYTSVYRYMYIYTHCHIYICEYIYIYIHIYTYRHTRIHTYIYTCSHICAYLYLSAHRNIHL